MVVAVAVGTDNDVSLCATNETTKEQIQSLTKDTILSTVYRGFSQVVEACTVQVLQPQVTILP